MIRPSTISKRVKAGTNRVTLENKGKQIHEIDLVELAEGKKVEDSTTLCGVPGSPGYSAKERGCRREP